MSDERGATSDQRASGGVRRAPSSPPSAVLATLRAQHVLRPSALRADRPALEGRLDDARVPRR